jgi:hypothetical protein
MKTPRKNRRADRLRRLPGRTGKHIVLPETDPQSTTIIHTKIRKRTPTTQKEIETGHKKIKHTEIDRHGLRKTVPTTSDNEEVWQDGESDERTRGTDVPVRRWFANQLDRTHQETWPNSSDTKS